MPVIEAQTHLLIYAGRNIVPDAGMNMDPVATASFHIQVQQPRPPATAR
jgi:hypothetical protein